MSYFVARRRVTVRIFGARLRTALRRFFRARKSVVTLPIDAITASRPEIASAGLFDSSPLMAGRDGIAASCSAGGRRQLPPMSRFHGRVRLPKRDVGPPAGGESVREV